MKCAEAKQGPSSWGWRWGQRRWSWCPCSNLTPWTDDAITLSKVADLKEDNVLDEVGANLGDTSCHVSRGHDVGSRGRSLWGSLYSGQHFFEFLQDDHLVCIFRKIFEITQFYSSYTLTFFLLAAEVCLSSISTRYPTHPCLPDVDILCSHRPYPI